MQATPSNTQAPLSASQSANFRHITDTRHRGGQWGLLAPMFDDLLKDNMELLTMPKLDQVKPVMDAILQRWAEIHVHPDIRLSGPDAPRNFMFATFGGIAESDLPTDPLPYVQEYPCLGTSGIIVTLNKRVIFCQMQKTFPLVDGMCFWGWIGVKPRVAWRQHNGVLKDTTDQWALPQDADATAVESWARIENHWRSQHTPEKPDCRQPVVTGPFVTRGFVPINMSTIWRTPDFFKGFRAN